MPTIHLPGAPFLTVVVVTGCEGYGGWSPADTGLEATNLYSSSGEVGQEGD
jgi:hypothetical protein